VTGDGLDGFFDIEITRENVNGSGIVLICHGLEGHIKHPLVTKMASAFHLHGFQCCLIGFRGCERPATDRSVSIGAFGYHFGYTADLHITAEYIKKKYPYKRIYISGFSLGGNVALKMLGELGPDARHSNNVYGGIALCVPFDAAASQRKMSIGLNRAIYAESLLMTLKKKAYRMAANHPHIAIDIEGVVAAKTIAEFDGCFTCPLFGFKNISDYYSKTESKRWLEKITVPVVTINALDDPFIDEHSLPCEEDCRGAPVQLVYQQHGGHCGFLGAAKEPQPVGVRQGGRERSASAHGYLASEAARAIAHIERLWQQEEDTQTGLLFM
jgi:predicted alpha/beta-fold hydrolase